MAELNLEPAPHEIQPDRDSELDGEPFAFDALWYGEKRSFVGRTISQKRGQLVFFALTDEPALGNFVHAVNLAANGIPVSLSSVPNFFSPLKAREILEKGKHLSWGRLYILDEQLNIASDESVYWRLFICPDGYGHCSLLSGPSHHFPFRWHENPQDALRLALMPPLELLAHIRPFLLNPESDWAFARAFSSLYKEGQDERCHPLTRGSYEEWKRILCLFLQSQASTEKGIKVGEAVSVEIQPSEDKSGLTIQLKFNIHFPTFFNWTKQYFIPTVDTNLMSRCVAADYHYKRGFRFDLSVNSPTHHERLEARLQLREWLSDKATPSEVKWLLRDE